MKTFTRRICKNCDYYCVFYIQTSDFYEKKDYMERLDVGYCTRHAHVVLQDKFCRNFSNKILRSSAKTFSRAVNIETLLRNPDEIKQILEEQEDSNPDITPPSAS